MANNLSAALALTDNPDLPAGMTDVARLRDQVTQARAPRHQPMLPGDPADLVRRALDAGPDGFHAALDDAAHEWARRSLLGFGGDTLMRHLDALARQARADAADEIHSRLAAAFDERAGKLATAAAKLPPGEQALDPAAVLASDARRAYLTVLDALDELLTIAAGIEVTAPRIGGQPVRGAAIALLAEVPEVSEQRVDRVSRKPVNAAAEVEVARAVRDACDAFADDPRLALVDVARGEHDGITLAFAPSPAALADRLGQLRRAHAVRAVEAPVPA